MPRPSLAAGKAIWFWIFRYLMMEGELKEQLFWPVIVIFLAVFAGAIFLFNRDAPKNQQADLNHARNGRVYTVYHTSGVFSPTNLQINVGDTVRFFNDGILPLRVVSDPIEGSDLPLFDSISDIPPKSHFSFTFTKRGIFDYQNSKRPEQKGTIIVK